METISVIIPIYNVMPYLNRCIKSVVEQKYSDLEIICVDDCSTDESKKIINEWIAIDNRIKLISLKKNRGLSAARNAGINNSIGKYIYFLDSDDWIASHYLEEMHRMADLSGSDIVVNTNIQRVYESDVIYNESISSTSGKYLDRINAINTLPVTSWCRIYRRDFLTRNRLWFLVGYIHEDEYFNHLTMSYVDKVFAFHGPEYFYTQRNGSIMSTLKSRLPFLALANLLLKWYKVNPNIDTKGMKFINNRIVLLLNTDQEVTEFKEFYKWNLPYILKRGFMLRESDKFLFACLLASKNLDELTYWLQNDSGLPLFFLYCIQVKQKVRWLGPTKLWYLKHIIPKQLKNTLKNIRDKSPVTQLYRTKTRMIKKILGSLTSLINRAK